MAAESALVVGCGSIGRRHIRNMRHLGVSRIFVLDPDKKRVDGLRKEFRCAPVRSLREGLDRKPDLALICTPPMTHVPLAQAVLERGVPCFIEKPLSHALDQALRLEPTARKTRAALMVGYQLRLHPAIVWIKRKLDQGAWGKLLYLRAQFGQYLPDWRPWQDYRCSYTARKSQGGGILMDASHEIDLALHLAGDISRVFCATGKLSDLDIDVEDTAEITVWFQSGGLGSLHLDMLRRAYDRTCQLTCENGIVVWSCVEGLVNEFSARAKKWRSHRFSTDSNLPYLSELRHFIQNLGRHSAGGPAGLEDGLRALRVVSAARCSARTGRMQRVL